jgi:hypothetical protein
MSGTGREAMGDICHRYPNCRSHYEAEIIWGQAGELQTFARGELLAHTRGGPSDVSQAECLPRVRSRPYTPPRAGTSHCPLVNMEEGSWPARDQRSRLPRRRDLPLSTGGCP